MKSIIALTIAVLLLITGGSLLTRTVNEQTGQSCARGDEVNSYRNTWQDVYFFWQWWPSRDAGMSFIDCVGPTSYLRYHPYDAAALAFIGAGIAGWIGLKDQPKGKKKS